ncbi:Rib/alpha-like domain-containing protein [Lactobacillus sp. ESL0791]|uniref:Rib/alpha-like domain-containing protein n=1 Tax=Lactobacillus sp. ESL0791 TaxID=2983234 RepID=UPI0023F619FA|nr:Rib/alpha-like domain-containing protein [Lactobacillus sp. ESL0791]MDF7639197.1 Rib/alpha-like domain-containing protein [Lactobacillus sp. ESL0791]
MFGKNNFDEKLRRMEMQAKKDRFSIRKLAIGAASVLLGFSFMGAASQTAKADTLAAGQQETVVANKQVNAKDVANKPKLSTFSGLSAFLRGSSEEESSASEGSTASQASEASSASSSSASEASSSSQASESSQSSNASQASTGSTASQASQASSSGSEASAASTGSVSSDGAQKIKTTHANDIVIHHLLVDADGNKTTTPVKGLGDEKGDTYIDGYVGDTKTISATDPEQAAPDGYKIVADQKSVTWTFVKDQNKEITFYYTQVPTTQTDAAPSFAQQFNNKTTSYESPEKNTLYGDIPVGNGIRLRYFFGTTLDAPISGSMVNFNYTASCAIPNYNLISVSTDSTGQVTEHQINGGYAYYYNGTYYGNIRLGINGDINTLTKPIFIRLWNITTTGSKGNTLGAKLTALWSADYNIYGKIYTIDYTSVMESNGGLINYKTTARNVTGLVNDNHTIDAANNINHAFFGWNMDTKFLNNDQVPLFYIGNNQGIYLEGTSADTINGVHHKYRLNFNFSGPIAPTGWAGTYYQYSYTNPKVFGPSLSTALGQKVPKGQKAPDAGALAFGDASLADVPKDTTGGGETVDSGIFTIWDRQDLSVGDSQDIGYQSSIVDEMASAPKLKLDPNGEDYRGNEITIHGTVTEEDASLRDNLTYTYNIDGDSSTTHSWSGPKAADFVNNDAGFSFTVPAQPQLVDGKDHSITVTVTDANGTVATQTYALRAPAASITVHHYWMMSNGDLTTDKVKSDTYVGGKVGQSVIVGLNDPDQAAPTGYHLVPGQSDFKQVMPASGIGEVAFYYTGNATHDADKNNIIVHHVLKDSGQLVPGMNDTSVNGIVGETGIVKASDQPAPPAGYSLVPNQADQEFTFQPTVTQDAYVYYVAIAAKQGSSIKVHQVTIPGSTPVQVPQFSGDKWGEILDGDLSHVKSVDWADPIAVNQANGILATSGNKSADIKVTFDDETTFLISGAPVQVVGATAGDGQEFDSSTTAISKDQSFTDSKGYANISALSGIGDVDHYTFSDSADGSTNMNINWSTTNGTGQKQGYVLVHYKDGTAQAVPITIKIKSQSEQSGEGDNKLSQSNPMVMHVGESISGQDKYVSEGNRDKYFKNTNNVSSIAWNKRPNVNQTGTNTTGSVTVGFSDGSSKVLTGITVDVVGAEPNANASANSMKPLDPNPSKYLSDDSVGKIKPFNPIYSYVDDKGNDIVDANGKPTSPTFDASQNDKNGKQTAHIKVNYDDGTSQIVDVPISVTSQKDQNKNNIKVNNGETNPIRTHVNADKNYGLNTSVTIPGLTEGTDYSLSWASAPDVTAANLTNGEKKAKYTVNITYKDNTSDTADVWVDVVGGESSEVTTNFNVKDNAALTADKAKAALSTASTTAIGKLANGKNVKYSWASDENGTALNVDTSDSDGKTAYVIIDYGDGTKQAVAVNIHVKSQKEQHSGKIKVNNDETNPIRTHVNANQNYGLDTSVAIDGLTEGKDYTLSWLGDAFSVTDANLTNGEKDS